MNTPEPTFSELQSMSFRITSPATVEVMFESLKSVIDKSTYSELIEAQKKGLIVNIRIGVEENPDDATFITKSGLDKLSKMLNAFLDKKANTYEESVLWHEAYKLLNEVTATKGGWV